MLRTQDETGIDGSTGVGTDDTGVDTPALSLSNTGTFDLFGNSVALSGDGNTLAVGAYQEGSNATGIAGNQADNSISNSGAVYLY